MADNRLFQETVKALALGEGEKARGLIEQIPDEDSEDFAVYVSATFACAMGHVFDEDQGLEAIRRFVSEMGHAYRNANPPFKPLAMEAIIRVLFGEDHLLEEVTPKDQHELQIMAIRMAVHKSSELHAQLDLYLSEAVKLAAEWQ